MKIRLAAPEYPREMEFVTSLPKTKTGKIQRGVLREREVARRGEAWRAAGRGQGSTGQWDGAGRGMPERGVRYCVPRTHESGGEERAAYKREREATEGGTR